jgi:hypothetical protein
MKRIFSSKRFLLLPGMLVLAFLFAGCGSSRRNAEIEAAAKPHSVTLSWAAGPAGHVTGYNVFRDTLPGPVGVKLNEKPLSGTQFEDTTVEAGRTYAYYVTAVDARGHESGLSERVVAQVPEPESPSFITKLFHLFRSGS